MLNFGWSSRTLKVQGVIRFSDSTSCLTQLWWLKQYLARLKAPMQHLVANPISHSVFIESDKFAGKFGYSGSQPGWTELHTIRQGAQKRYRQFVIKVQQGEQKPEAFDEQDHLTILNVGVGWLDTSDWPQTLTIMGAEVCRHMARGQVVILYPEDPSTTNSALLIFAAVTKRIFGKGLADTMDTVSRKYSIPQDIKDYCKARKIVLQYHWNLASQHLPTIHTFLTWLTHTFCVWWRNVINIKLHDHREHGTV